MVSSDVIYVWGNKIHIMKKIGEANKIINIFLNIMTQDRKETFFY